MKREKQAQKSKNANVWIKILKWNKKDSWLTAFTPGKG